MASDESQAHGKGCERDVGEENIGRALWTQQTFEEGAASLVLLFDEEQLSSAISDWSIQHETRHGLYLVRKIPFESQMKLRSDLDVTDGATTNLEDDMVFIDDSVSTENGSDDVKDEALWDLSIVYSHTYDAPVLFFTVHHLDGSPCSRKDIVRYLQGRQHQNQVEDAWDFVSMDQHHMTGLPSFFLHPCMTRQRMESLLSNSPRSSELVLLSWMSMALVALGFEIPPRIYQHIVTNIIAHSMKQNA
jgi:hypothetical protein